MAKEKSEQKSAPIGYESKLSTKTLGLNARELEEIAAKSDGRVSVAMIYGRVDSMEEKTTDIGPSMKFNGQFEGINLITRNRARSKSLYLPGIVEQCLIDGVNQAKNDSPEAVLEFGLEVQVEKNLSTKGGFKFKYAVKPLGEDKRGRDSLTALGEQFGEPKYLTMK